MKSGAASGRKEMREARTQHFLHGSVPLAVDFGQEVSSCCQADSSTKVPEDEQEVNATNCGDPHRCERECHRAFPQHHLLPHL